MLAEVLLGLAARQADHREAVLDLGRAARHHDRHLVGERQLCPHHRVVTQVYGHILRLRMVAQDVQHVEVLADLDEIDEVAERARTAPAVEVTHVGAARAADEDERAGREFDGTPRIAAEPLERARAAREGRSDDVAAEPHDLSALVDEGTGTGIKSARFRQQHLDAECLQDLQGVFVQRRYGVVRKYALGNEGIAQSPVRGRASVAGRPGSLTGLASVLPHGSTIANCATCADRKNSYADRAGAFQ